MPERLKNKEYSVPLESELAKEQAEVSAPKETPLTAQPFIVASPLPLFSHSPTTTASEAQKEFEAIETILAEGLDDVYSHMNTEEQEKFKQQGEATASTIQKMLHTAIVQVQKIFGLILTWLRSIPKVNKFFLEQEAKIKTDKILALPIK